jgi:putative phosphoribosyl transferase
MRPFINRRQAGRMLASRLLDLKDRRDVIVLALPRGGVPVAYEVARALRVPLDVVVVRELGVPGHPGLAMGAVAGGHVCVLDRPLLRELRVERADFDRVLAAERKEIRRREHVYRGSRPPLHLAGRTAVLVEDGIATGATMAAAITAATQQHAAHIVVAAPVASRAAAARLSAEGHEVVVLLTPEPFDRASSWYECFAPTCDAEVMTLLAAGWRDQPRLDPATGPVPPGDRPAEPFLAQRAS